MDDGIVANSSDSTSRSKRDESASSSLEWMCREWVDVGEDGIDPKPAEL